MRKCRAHQALCFQSTVTNTWHVLVITAITDKICILSILKVCFTVKETLLSH